MTSENSYEMTADEQAVFDSRSSRLNKSMGLAIRAKSDMEAAINKAFDAGSEFGFELGAIEKEMAILDKIDEIFNALTDDEEDAKLTLGIVKEAILRLEIEND